MKQKSITSICKPTVTLLAAAAIILLCRKDIIPVYTILLLTAALRAGRLKENHPRYAPVFSFAKP